MNQTPLLGQIRVYSEALVDDLPDITTVSNPNLAARPEPGPRRGPWVGVTTAVATLAFIGLIPFLIDGESETVDTIAPTTVPPFTAELAGPQDVWSRVAHDDAVFGGDDRAIGWASFTGQQMVSVTVGGPGLVAVGSDKLDAAVWTSVDGITWTRVPHDDAVFGGATMGSVTVGGPGLVAVGPGQVESGGDAAVWTSVDGFTWTRVPHDDAVFGEARMNSVTAGGPGLVAVGTGNGEEAAVWVSVDGLAWARVPHDETVFGGATTMVSVTVGGPGLVAVGWDSLDYHLDLIQAGAAVWTSVDGITWARVPHDEAVFGGGVDPVLSLTMVSVTSGGPGLVAVGSELFGRRGAVWTSVDGITWTRVADGATFSGPMMSVTSRGSGLVAVGSDAEVWTSPDGITWTHVAGTGGQTIGSLDPRCFATNCPPYPDDAEVSHTMLSVTVGGPGLVAVGTVEKASYQQDAAVWNATSGN